MAAIRGLIFIFLVATMTEGAMCRPTVIADLSVARQRTLAVAGMSAVGIVEAEEEGGKPHNASDKNTSDYPMKFSNQFTRFSSLLTIPLLACAWGILPATLHAAEPKSGDAEQSFTSSDEAIAALKTAVAANDRAALRKLFGPEFPELLTGDAVQDANNTKRFAASMAQSCEPVKDGDDKIALEVGPNNWPMPIPLVKVDGQWHFNTAAGKEEIINRHIGKDELHAIGVCRAYVTAQRQYASETPNSGAGTTYAQHLKSAPGKKDGLYWPAADNESASPFGPLVAEAQAEGYVLHAKGTGPHPFHGYYFRILTRQGEAAPGGKMDYLSHGNLTGGFALVAYPEHWDQSGIMTFIVNQDGKVYQRNLGEKTSQLAGAIKTYNPDSEWALEQDEGISDAVSQK